MTIDNENQSDEVETTIDDVPQGGAVVEVNDDDDDEPVAASSPAAHKSRKEKRAERFRMLMSEAESKGREAARAEAEELRSQMRALQQQVAAGSRQVAPAEADPIDQIEERQQMILERLRSASSISDDEEKRLRQEYRKMDREKQRMIAREEVQRSAPKVSAGQEILTGEFPEIFSNERNKSLAKLSYDRLVLLGEPDGLATARKAARSVMSDLGLGEAKAPSNTQRSKYAGTSSMAGTSASTSKRVVLDAPLMQMAKAMFPRLDDDQAAAQYYKSVLEPNKIM